MSGPQLEPPKSGHPGAQRWADYLDWVREEAITAVLALPRAGRHISILPSGWTPSELLHHLLHMEQRWFVWGFLAEPVDQPWGDWNVADPGAPQDAEPSPRWQVPPELDVEEIADRLRKVGERTSAVLADHSLSTPARLGGRFRADPPTLEWICFHVLTEYARHLGQLDIVLELGTRRRGE